MLHVVLLAIGGSLMLSAVGKQRLWTLQEMQAECCVQTKPSKQGVVQHEQAAAVLRDFCLILILLALSDLGLRMFILLILSQYEERRCWVVRG